MRRIAIVVTAAVLIACGQPSASGPSEAAAQPSAATESQADYTARCTREMIAANPQSRQWAAGQCEQNWALVVAAGPMADAILAAVPAPGESVAGAAVRARVTSVRWAGRPEGALLAQGTLGDVSVQVEAAALNFFWDEVGEMIPYDVIGALQGRGAQVAMVGCAQLGTGEFSKVYRVTAPGKAPFQLGVYDRMAPTANANSFYNVNVGLNGRIATIADMRRDGSEVTPTCPY
jgi:hypothetical protein